MKTENIEAFLDRRLSAIEQGLKEGVRREVDMRRRQGLPLVVSNNGKVETIQAPDKKRS